MSLIKTERHGAVLRVQMQDADNTLQDAQIEQVMVKVLNALQTQVGARLR